METVGFLFSVFSGFVGSLLKCVIGLWGCIAVSLLGNVQVSKLIQHNN